MGKLARFISYLFHPAVMPLMGYYLIMHLEEYRFSGKIFLAGMAILLVGTYLVPGALSLLLLRMDVVSSIHLPNAEDRRFPYMIGGFFYAVTAGFMQLMHFPVAVSGYLWTLTFLLLAGRGLLPWTKLSAHTGGAAGFAALTFYLSDAYGIPLYGWQMVAVLLVGAVGTSRLLLKAHKPTEIYLGAAVGFLAVYFGMHYLFTN